MHEGSMGGTECNPSRLRRDVKPWMSYAKLTHLTYPIALTETGIAYPAAQYFRHSFSIIHRGFASSQLHDL